MCQLSLNCNKRKATAPTFFVKHVTQNITYSFFIFIFNFYVPRSDQPGRMTVVYARPRGAGHVRTEVRKRILYV